MNTGVLFTISAPSGAGKTSLVKALVQRNPSIRISVSHTTRAKRPGEVDGQDYFFVSKDEFIKRVNAGGFLEHAEVFGNYYGTSQRAVDDLLRQGQDVILEIDWQGASQVRRLRPGVVSVFILPPSRTVLEQRLRDRGQDSEAVIARRLAAAREEISHYGESDYLIINEDFEQALQELETVVRSQRLRREYQQTRFMDLIRQLLSQPS
ncbi:MAG TPA: guanylate kinase [Gammaproteobacteria bacterium]|nr:guanylate kinase [Gammaproteobacteria bacterium]